MRSKLPTSKSTVRIPTTLSTERARSVRPSRARRLLSSALAFTLTAGALTSLEVNNADTASAQESVAPINPLADGKLNYISLGDSYAAGNAAVADSSEYYGPNQPNLTSITDPFGASCYMSTRAASFLLSKKISSSTQSTVDHVHQACSGAVTEEVMDRDARNNGSVEDQIEKSVRKQFYNVGIKNNELISEMPFSMKDAELISLSTGGNDIGFSNLLICGLAEKQLERLYAFSIFLYGNDSAKCNKLTEEKINKFFQDNYQPEVDRLTKIYNKIAQEAPNATILITNYPSIISTNTDNNCTFTPDVVKSSEELTNWLNRLINDAVTTSINGQYGKLPDGSNRFVFADISKAFYEPLNPYAASSYDNDKRLCSPADNTEEAVNGLSSPKMETGHPNILGHKLISEVMMSALAEKLTYWKFNSSGLVLSGLDLNNSAKILMNYDYAVPNNPNSTSANTWSYIKDEYAGFDLNSLVRSVYHQNAVATTDNPSNPYSWYAKRTGGIDLYQACRNQYSNNEAFAQLVNYTVYGWICNQWVVRGNGGIDVSRACIDQQGAGTYPLYFDYNDAYSLRCFRWQSNLDIDVTYACKTQVNPNSHAITFNSSNPYTWGCWLLNWRNQPVRYVGGVNMDQACKTQYGNPFNMRSYLSSYSAFGWKCIGDRPISGIDMNLACKQQYGSQIGGINPPYSNAWTVLIAPNVASWACYAYKYNGGVDIANAARLQSGDNRAQVSFTDYNNPYTWGYSINYGGLNLNNLAKLQTSNPLATAELLGANAYDWRINNRRVYQLTRYDLDRACRTNLTVIKKSAQMSIPLTKIQARNNGSGAYGWQCVVE